MPKKLERPTVARHFLFFEEDLDFLDLHYGPRSAKGLSLNEIVRAMIHAGVKDARARMLEAAERRAAASRSEAKEAGI